MQNLQIERRMVIGSIINEEREREREIRVKKEKKKVHKRKRWYLMDIINLKIEEIMNGIWWCVRESNQDDSLGKEKAHFIVSFHPNFFLPWAKNKFSGSCSLVKRILNCISRIGTHLCRVKFHWE